uniref:Coiled-coil domain-containing protein 9 n=1 Tax=Octopus bimaculoides TaxID=37653 RepID=A0A0L8FQR7_OCTBM
MTPTVDSLILPDLKFYSKILSELEVKRRPKPPARGKGPGNRVKERPKSLDENGDLCIDSVYRGRRSMHAVGSTGGQHRLERMTTVPNNEMNEIHIQITDNVPEYRPNFANIRQTRDKHREREREKTTDFNGPPPDPAYNFLADRRREGPGYDRGDRDGGGGGGGGSSGSGGRGGGGGGECSNLKDNRAKDVRRHPKNYGGIDFQNVKSKMKAARDRQSFNSTPPTKMEMSISMTGRERRQYMEWKAERDRVDKERIERQKSASGEWRREWDAEKHQQEYEENSNARRQELSRRPAGRIGSGRFDRGERDDRQRGEAPGTKVVSCPAEVVELKRPSRIGEKADKGKKLLGRGRGRGRGITAPPRSRIIPANLASDSRKVECTRDLLVVKIDNAPGAQDDVEVEYSDTDNIALRSVGGSGIASASIPISYDQTSHSIVSSPYSKSCPTSGCAPAEKMWDTIQENSWDQSQINLQNGDHLHCGNDEEDDDDEDDDDDDDEEGVMLEDEYIEDGELYSGIYEDAENEANYGLVHGMVEGEEWEDCPDEDDFCVEDGHLVYDKTDKIQETLRLDCQLNPEAPAFVPTSPDFLNAPSENDKTINLASIEHAKESLVQNKNKSVQLPILSSSSAKEFSANTVDKDEVHENKVLNDSSSFSSSSLNQNLCKSDSQKVVENPDKLTKTDNEGLNCHDKCEDKADGDAVDDSDAKLEDSSEAFTKSLSDSDSLVPDTDIETNKLEETNLDPLATKSDETVHSHNEQSANKVENSDSETKVTTETVRSENEHNSNEQIAKAENIIKETDVVDNKDSKELKSEDTDSKEDVASKSEDSEKTTVPNSETDTKTEIVNDQASVCNTESIVDEQKVDVKIEDNICKEELDKSVEENVSTESTELSENLETKTSGETDDKEGKAPVKEDQSKADVGDNSENCLNVTSDASKQRNDNTNRDVFYPTEEVCAVTIKETLQTVKDAGAWKLSVKDDIETVSVYKSSNESNASDSKTEGVAAAGSVSSSSSSQNPLKETVSNNLPDSNNQSVNNECNDLHKSSTDEKSKTESPDLVSDCSEQALNSV